MKVLIASKALMSATYRQKLVELARLGVEASAVVPPEWRERGAPLRFEPGSDREYDLIVSPIRWSGRYHLYYFPELPTLIRRHRPAIVHVDEEPYNLSTYLATRAARQSSIPSLFYTYQNLRRRYPMPFALMERAVYRSASLALASGEEAAGVLRSKGFCREVVVVPQFGVDPSVFHPGRKEQRPFTVGFLNRLIPAKAPILMLDAFCALPEDTKLWIVGDGPLRPQLEKEIARRGLAQRVTIQSRISSEDVPEVLRELDVVVLPSLTTRRWKEQFGRVLVEAMSCEVPVVGSDSGEIPTVVGDAGLIVPEGSTDGLAGALRQLYDRPELRARLGQRGRQRVLERFTHARVAELTHRAYCRILKR